MSDAAKVQDVSVHEGGCLCGAVRYSLTGKLRQVVNCHCGQCLKTHGHVAAYSGVARAGLEVIEGRGLTWYDSSAFARRGFCRFCGSSLFWESPSQSHISVSAGTLDQPTGLRTIGEIFVADKSDYYELDERLPAFPGSSNGALTKLDEEA